jgi:hypothetical protein
MRKASDPRNALPVPLVSSLMQPLQLRPATVLPVMLDTTTPYQARAARRVFRALPALLHPCSELCRPAAARSATRAPSVRGAWLTAVLAPRAQRPSHVSDPPSSRVSRPFTLLLVPTAPCSWCSALCGWILRVRLRPRASEPPRATVRPGGLPQRLLHSASGRCRGRLHIAVQSGVIPGRVRRLCGVSRRPHLHWRHRYALLFKHV